jgi:hypothetical protein
MSDLVQRLRAYHSRLMTEAADRIEELEAALPQGRYCSDGYILMPQSRDDAEKMYLLAEKYLFPDGPPPAALAPETEK